MVYDVKEQYDRVLLCILRFFYLLKPQKKLLMQIFFASLVYTILGIIGAFYFQELIDTVLPDALSKTLMTLSIGVILLNVFKVILNAFRSHLLLYLSQKLDIALLLGFNKWYENLNRKQMEDNAQLTSYMVESLNGVQTVKAYNAEPKVNLKNGMACTGKVIIGEKTVMKYLLEKINLLD